MTRWIAEYIGYGGDIYSEIMKRASQTMEDEANMPLSVGMRFAFGTDYAFLEPIDALLSGTEAPKQYTMPNTHLIEGIIPVGDNKIRH
jgi:hypothetical protein